MSSDSGWQKTEMRRTMRTLRASVGESERAKSSSAIVARVLAQLEKIQLLNPESKLAIYLANAGEANLDQLIAPLQMRGLEVFAPHFEDTRFPFYQLAENGENIGQSTFGKIALRAPKEYSGGMIATAAEMDAILLPGLGFDISGNRIGQGGGWYDRVLASAPQAVKIGVAFDCQIVDSLPREAHDQTMNFVVTERRVLYVSGE